MPIVVVALASRFVLALMVIGLVAIGVTDSDLGDVTAAVAATLGVGLLVELGVISPLSRRWDLSMNETVMPIGVQQ